MADIVHDFWIEASPERVFQAVSDPAQLDRWWTLQSSGHQEEGAAYTLGFGPQYDWRAVVTRCDPGREFELELREADADWTGTRVGFTLESHGAGTRVRFRHAGWPAANEHYRISSFCWAMYLRLLRRFIEHGETVPYESRLDV
jgi:uncharacterized protein YndB with AHSA1/START domain